MEERRSEERRNEERQNSVQKVYLNNRHSAVLSGVLDVLSFDSGEIYLDTTQGILLIQGDELHVNRLSLDKGEVDIDGVIDRLSYSDREEPMQQARGILGRLLG